MPTMTKFKRTTTRLVHHETLPEQDVRIIREIEGDDEGDRFLIQTSDGKTHKVYEDQMHPAPHAPELNTEFMVRMMTGDSPLVEAFVIEAVAKYAEQVLEMTDEEREAMKNSMISPAAWERCAAYCKAEINAKYKGG